MEGRIMEERAEPFILAAGESRRADALLPFKVCAPDTGGLFSACEFTLGAWESWSGAALARRRG